MKVGVFGDKVNEAWLSELGAAAVPFGHGLEAIPSLTSSGKLDAVVTTWRNFENGDLWRGYKYVGLMGSTYLVSVTYVNEPFFKSLPEAYQKLLVEESRAAGRIERAKTIELNARAKREMLDKGVRPTYMSEAGRKAFDQALRPARERIEKILGRTLVERIKNAPDAPASPSIPDGLAQNIRGE